MSGTEEMDQFSYHYLTGINRLLAVNDAPSFSNNYASDMDGISPNNYLYDNIGNLTDDPREKMTIAWLANGKIESTTRRDDTDLPNLEFTYDAMGNRVGKLVKPRVGGFVVAQDEWKKVFYTRDAQGNVLATYERTWNGWTTGEDPASNNVIYTQADDITLNEHHLYGSSRLAIRNKSLRLNRRELNYSGSGPFDPYSPDLDTTIVNDRQSIYIAGQKKFELTNHLGNVLSVITDNVWAREDVNNDVDLFTPHIVGASDYYPFGMIMPGALLQY